MAGKLVTIATFDQAAQAWVAENVLKDAGIKAAVSDETLVAMDWLMSGVVGGVKVQVLEEDADRAVAVLENQFGENGEGLGGAVPPEELATQAEAAVIDDGEEQPVRPAPGSALEPEDGPWIQMGVKSTRAGWRSPPFSCWCSCPSGFIIRSSVSGSSRSRFMACI